jgi:hypothetical protein
MVSVAAIIVMATTALAQEPPSWVNLGNLASATKVRDLLEIPTYNVVVACGMTSSGNFIWRTTDGGTTWTTLYLGTGDSGLVQLLRDPANGRLWVVGMGASNPLYFSDDVGTTWTLESPPQSNPLISGRSIELVGNYLYFGGTVSSPYSIALYRLDLTNQQWELVTQYPQCSGITRLKYNNGKLLVFAKDKTSNMIRVFNYTPSDLDAGAVPVGKAETSKATSEEPKK